MDTEPKTAARIIGAARPAANAQEMREVPGSRIQCVAAKETVNDKETDVLTMLERVPAVE